MQYRTLKVKGQKTYRTHSLSKVGVQGHLYDTARKNCKKKKKEKKYEITI